MLSVALVDDAVRQRNPEDLACALIIGFVFGFPRGLEDALCSIVSEVWHFSHEDVVEALQELGSKTQKVADALYSATQIVPGYLEYDESRALAVKAIWALGKFNSDIGDKKLSELSISNEALLRIEADRQLSVRMGVRG
jgi:hypothetical protein